MLHEFYVNVTRKIRTPLSKAEARLVVATYIPWCLHPETGDVHEAFRIEDEASISFWDALIVATAARSGATQVLSEDLDPDQIVSGVSVINPFLEAAEPSTMPSNCEEAVVAQKRSVPASA